MRLTPAIEYLFPTHSPAWEDHSDDQPSTSALNDSHLSDTLLSPHRPAASENAASENEVPTVLVVDDEDDVRHLVVTALGRAGYRVLQAADGESALYLAQEHAPDLIVMDLMMPGTDGLELCRQLREDVCLATVPVVMLTAKTARGTCSTASTPAPTSTSPSRSRSASSWPWSSSTPEAQRQSSRPCPQDPVLKTWPAPARDSRGTAQAAPSRKYAAGVTQRSRYRYDASRRPAGCDGGRGSTSCR